MKIKSPSATTSNNPVPYDFVDPAAYFQNPSLFEGAVNNNTCPDAIDMSGDSLDSNNNQQHQLRPGGFESNASTISRVTVKTPFDDMNDNWVDLLNEAGEVEEWNTSTTGAAASPPEQVRGSNESNGRRAPPPTPMAKTSATAATQSVKAKSATNAGEAPPPIPPRPAVTRRSTRNVPTSSSSSSSSANPATITAQAPQPQPEPKQAPAVNRVPAFMTLGVQTAGASSSSSSAATAAAAPRSTASAQSSAASFFQPFSNDATRTSSARGFRPVSATPVASASMMNQRSNHPVVSPFQSMMMANSSPAFTIPPPQQYPSISGLTSGTKPSATMGVMNRPPPFNPSYKPDAFHRKTGYIDVDEPDPYQHQPNMSLEYMHRKQREAEDAQLARMLQEEEESVTEAKRLREEQERMSLQKAIELMEEENRCKQMEEEFQLQYLQQQLEAELAEEEARRIALEMEGAEVARMLAAQEQMAYEEQRQLEEEGLKVAMALQKEEEEAEERRLKQLEEERLRRQREEEAREAERKRQIWMATPDARFVGKRCPNCRQIIYKDVGCDSVKCICGKTFNYGVAEVINNVPPPEPVPAPNSSTSPGSQTSSASAGDPRRRSSRTFGSLFRRSSSQHPEPTIPIARPGFGQQQQQQQAASQDDTDCGATRAPTGPRPTFLDDFLKSTEETATRGSYECFMCNDRQSDVFFHCCKGIVCIQCTRLWLTDNQTCPKCRAQLTRPPEKLVLN